VLTCLIEWVLKRTRNCGELSKDDVGKEVVLNGWVHTIRKVGKLIFILLRDRSGIVQVVVTPKNKAYELAKSIDREYVIAVKGIVRARPPKQVNPEMPTGEIEVSADDLEILNESKPLPLPIWDEELMRTTSETNRLKYRFLDLRRDKLRRNIILRAEVTEVMREFYRSKGFIEIETPYLARSTPEGARDFLVPSRLHPRKFYALTQSPQLFKQLLMVAGFEKYFQVARCFRDEDPRADRQPEFTQFDMEMSFVSREDVMHVVEESMKYVFKKVLNITLRTPFPRLTYEEAIRKYGTDKPDIRFGAELRDLESVEPEDLDASSTDVVRGFKIVPGNGLKSEVLGHLGKIFSSYGVKALVVDSSGKTYLGRMSSETINKVIQELRLGSNELGLLASGPYMRVSKALGEARTYLGRVYELADPKKFSFLWVYEFPFFETDEDSGRLTPRHHPFTMPKPEDLSKLEEDPLKVKALAYDLVLNGYEVAGGSIRIHDRRLQERMLSLLGLSKEEMLERYGFLLEALEYGAPPHGGIAFGLDRLVAVMAGEESIREVIAFPKNKEMFDPLTRSPAEAPKEYLRDIPWLKIK